MEFETKPELARQMIHTALEHVPNAWVAGDEVYGRNPGLRSYLEQQRVGYVMEMAATDRMATPRGPLAVKELAVLVPEEGWQKRSAEAGSQGERFYDWALADDHTDAAGVRWVLIRRNRTSGELAFFRCYAPRAVSLARLVAVAGGGILRPGQCSESSTISSTPWDGRCSDALTRRRLSGAITADGRCWNHDKTEVQL